MGAGNVGQIVVMDEIIAAEGGELRIAVTQQNFPPKKTRKENKKKVARLPLKDRWLCSFSSSFDQLS